TFSNQLKVEPLGTRQIAQDDQLGDLVAVHWTIEYQNKRFWKAAPVKISVDMRRQNAMSVVVDVTDHVDGKLFADNVTNHPFANCVLSPVMAKLVIPQRVIDESV